MAFAIASRSATSIRPGAWQSSVSFATGAEWASCGTFRSALDPVVHVGDTGLPVEDPGALQLDVLGTEVVEETAPLAEKHRSG
jgi:hypothetical protein